MNKGHGGHLNGRLGLRAAGMAAQFKVRVCGLDLLPLWLNGGSVCDDSAAESGMRKFGAILANLIFSMQTLHYLNTRAVRRRRRRMSASRRRRF